MCQMYEAVLKACSFYLYFRQDYSQCFTCGGNNVEITDHQLCRVLIHVSVTVIYGFGAAIFASKHPTPVTCQSQFTCERRLQGTC